MAIDPLFGDLHEVVMKDSKPTKVSKSKPKLTKTFKGSSFTTIATSSNAIPILQKSSVTLNCMSCKGKHGLDGCCKFSQESHDDKISFLKRNGVGFGCLNKGHISKNCKKRMTCKECTFNHPTVLHMQKRANNSQIQSENSLASSALVCMEANTHTGSGSIQITPLPVIPVQVKSASTNQVVCTYAFLNPGSSATFCTEALKHKLQISGRNSRILLHTMGQEKPVNTTVLTGLTISSLNGVVIYELPDVYTQREIPVVQDQVNTIEALKKWPYLKEVHIPSIKADVGLLIGMNAPKLLEPWKIINSQGDGPYAVKTVLGWVVNGLIEHCRTEKDTAVYANHISVSDLANMLVKQYNHDFPEKEYKGKSELSQEDKRFMSLMENAQIKDGHYQLPLPFKNFNVEMPDNYQLALQRMSCLLRRFERDPMFKDEYVSFLENVIAKGHAEIVPQEELKKNNGKVSLQSMFSQ